jgi:ribosomal protein L11 methyltransferase
MRCIEEQRSIESALDVGTGSGILAIACALIHSESKILALDIDPQSIQTARENLDINQVTPQVELRLGTTTMLKDKRFKHIFSNLTCEDIVALLPEYERLLMADGLIFCAGILQEKFAKLENALEARHWTIVHRQPETMWMGVTITRH